MNFSRFMRENEHILEKATAESVRPLMTKGWQLILPAENRTRPSAANGHRGYSISLLLPAQMKLVEPGQVFDSDLMLATNFYTIRRFLRERPDDLIHGTVIIEDFRGFK